MSRDDEQRLLDLLEDARRKAAYLVTSDYYGLEEDVKDAIELVKTRLRAQVPLPDMPKGRRIDLSQDDSTSG